MEQKKKKTAKTDKPVKAVKSKSEAKVKAEPKTKAKSKAKAKDKAESKPKKVTGYHHFTMCLYPNEWEKIQYLASGANKTPSRFLQDAVMAYDPDKEPVYERTKYLGECKSRSFAFTEQAYQEIQQTRVKKFNMKISSYILGIVLKSNG